jgi:hypothetical protein
VFIFTAALFFSGYAIQQRTLRDLRLAIKPSPRPSPKIFLPDRFQKSTTELEDGTVVAVDDDDDTDYNSLRTKKQGVVVEVRPTLPDDVADGSGSEGQQQQQQQRIVDTDDGAGPTKTNAVSEAKTEPEILEKPISRAERRRRIKEEIQKLAQGQERGYYQRRLY